MNEDQQILLRLPLCAVLRDAAFIPGISCYKTQNEKGKLVWTAMVPPMKR